MCRSACSPTTFFFWLPAMACVFRMPPLPPRLLLRSVWVTCLPSAHRCGSDAEGPCCAATAALRTPIGERSGIIGLVIQLARDLQLACEDNADLHAALAAQPPWLDLTGEHGPLAKLLAQQQGSLAGGKPNTASLQVRTPSLMPPSRSAEPAAWRASRRSVCCCSAVCDLMSAGAWRCPCTLLVRAHATCPVCRVESVGTVEVRRT